MSVEDKLRLVRFHRARQDYQLLADQLRINRSTARNIVSVAMRQEDPENIVERVQGGPRNIKVDDEMRRAIELFKRVHRNTASASFGVPAYSPMLTPVGNVFSAWMWDVKNRLSEPSMQASFSSRDVARHEDMNLNQWRHHLLLQVGEAAIPAVTAAKVTNWQQHCMSYFPRCLTK